MSLRRVFSETHVAEKCGAHVQGERPSTSINCCIRHGRVKAVKGKNRKQNEKRPVAKVARLEPQGEDLPRKADKEELLQEEKGMPLAFQERNNAQQRHRADLPWLWDTDGYADFHGVRLALRSWLRDGVKFWLRRRDDKHPSSACYPIGGLAGKERHRLHARK